MLSDEDINGQDLKLGQACIFIPVKIIYLVTSTLYPHQVEFSLKCDVFKAISITRLFLLLLAMHRTGLVLSHVSKTSLPAEDGIFSKWFDVTASLLIVVAGGSAREKGLIKLEGCGK